MSNGEAIGVVVVSRKEPGKFAPQQVQLLQTFADQAVIAIQNARQINETQEALQQQTATADVLKVISRSAFDVQAVLDTLVESAYRLCAPCRAHLCQERRRLRMQGHRRARRPRGRFLVQGPSDPRGVRDRRRARHHDRRSSEHRGFLRRSGLRSQGRGRSPQRPPRNCVSSLDLAVPLKRDDAVVGVIVIAPSQTGPFPLRQVELLQTFADQAVIAIENARLFNEVQAKTRDLSEALQQQTATADVLEVISRSAFDLNAVFETVAESSVRLCGADRASIFRFDGEMLRMAVSFNASAELIEFLRQNPIRPGRHSCSARAALERRSIQIADVRADPGYTYGARDAEPIRTVLRCRSSKVTSF